MQLPILNEEPLSRTMLQEFHGYNHNIRISDTEFYNETNMSCDSFPVLSPREPRGISKYFSGEDAQGVLGFIFKDTLYYLKIVDGYLTLFRHSDEGLDDSISLGVETDSTEPRQMISMGAYIVVWPDKVVVNTTELQDIKLTKKYDITVPAGTYTSDENGNEIEAVKPTAGYWYNFDRYAYLGEYVYADNTFNGNDGLYRLYKWDSTLNRYADNQVSTEYSVFCMEGVGNLVEVGDNVEINSQIGQNEALRAIITTGGTSVVKILDNDKIVIENHSAYFFPNDENLMQTLPSYNSKLAEFVVWGNAEFEADENIPNLKFVIENDNRLWGCLHEEVNGQMVNEIHACALGNPVEWDDFSGESDDSYVVSVGSDGDFTGSAVYGGNVLFFKENCIHKIYGNYPANYSLVTTKCRGVQKGCEDSVKVVNELLYYKSRDDVCVYDGSLPQSISDALGDESYSDACAGTEGNKYYISMKDRNNDYHMFVYDAKYGVWHREDSIKAECFINDDKGLLFYTGDSLIRTKYLEGEDLEKADNPLQWECETGVIGFDSPDNEYVSRMNFRMQLEQGATCSMFIEYDSSGIWESKGAMKGSNLRTFTLPVIPRRCDHFRIKFSGHGGCKIFSIAKITEQGSDVR